MKLQVIVAGPSTQAWKVLYSKLENQDEVESVLVAPTIPELAHLLSSQHVDLLFVHQSFLEEDILLSLPTFVVLAETSNIQQELVAFRLRARGHILENVSEEELKLILHAVEQGREDTFFLNAASTCEILNEVVDILIPVINIDNLSPREQEILYLLHDGLLNKDIEKQLCISNITVRTHIASIKRKLNVTRHQIPSLHLPKCPTNSPPRA